MLHAISLYVIYDNGVNMLSYSTNEFCCSIDNDDSNDDIYFKNISVCKNGSINDNDDAAVDDDVAAAVVVAAVAAAADDDDDDDDDDDVDDDDDDDSPPIVLLSLLSILNLYISGLLTL
jgi:hypothetical protein